jgi:hypothetical protein
MSLTTLAKVKSQLDIPASDTSQDVRLTTYLNAASSAIESYCERKFEQATYTEYHHGRRMNFIMPREFPIVSVTTLNIDNDRLYPSDKDVPVNEYSIADRNRTIFYSGKFPQGFNNIKLVYTAGYATIPGDVELACIWACEWFVKHRERKDMGRVSVSKGDESVGILASMPPMILELINPYKRCEPPDINNPIENR